MVMQSNTKIPIALIQKRIALMKPFLIYLKNVEVNGKIKPFVSEISEIINLTKGKYEANYH
jgi:hypothetical protein